MSVTERRSTLIESAYRVIADHGVEGATTRRICAHADMPLASFHYAFESRTALLCAVMETAVPTDINQMLDTILAADGAPADGPIERMQANMNAQLDAFRAMLRADPGRLQATISLGIYAHNHPELRRIGKQMYERLYEVAADGLAAAADRAGVRWSEPVQDLAPVMIAATNAVTLIYLSTADDRTVEKVIAALIHELMSHVVAD